MEKTIMGRLMRRFKREKGEIAVFLACYMVILILCMALTADLGNTYLTHLRMRNAVDLAAESIGVQLPSTYSPEKLASLRSTAETIVQQNGIDLGRVNMTCEILQDSGQIYAAKNAFEATVNAGSNAQYYSWSGYATRTMSLARGIFQRMS